jgi:hypothetical protein
MLSMNISRRIIRWLLYIARRDNCHNLYIQGNISSSIDTNCNKLEDAQNLNETIAVYTI